MCYDISFTVKMKELRDYFPELFTDNQIDFEFGPFDHLQGPGVFPELPVIFHNKEKQPECRLMEWGILESSLPEYTDTDNERFKAGRTLKLNIRSERILDDEKSYWNKIKTNRCLIPVTGIFEHRHLKGKKRSVPYFVQIRGEKIFFLPGLYSVFNDRYTVGIITRAANEIMSKIHNSGENGKRMPLFLKTQMAKQFIAERLNENDYKSILAYSIPSGELIYHTVYPLRGSLRPDQKQKHKLFEYPGLPELGRMNPDEENNQLQQSLF